MAKNQNQQIVDDWEQPKSDVPTPQEMLAAANKEADEKKKAPKASEQPKADNAQPLKKALGIEIKAVKYRPAQ